MTQSSMAFNSSPSNFPTITNSCFDSEIAAMVQAETIRRNSAANGATSAPIPTPSSTTTTTTTLPLHTSVMNGNIEDNEPPLFSLSYISPEVVSLLPENYTLRPLRRSDYLNGYLDVLSVLTKVGEFSTDLWNQRFDWISSRNDEYFLLVICDGTGRVVGTGSLIVERKFIHSAGLVGHIEDIAIERGQQGKKLGLRMIHALDYVAEKVGCYKSILDCSEPNEGFYIKCGFRRAGLEMAHYY
ncbi:Glucosamine-phosphate N-acetyltransferase-like protein [Myotisia sp. PD_48]|nr:Glucosamine-phosphate N-acetyltransferase-like protein [Myotisia sp. PD_48]